MRVGRSVNLVRRLYQHWKKMRFTDEGIITPWGTFQTFTAEAFVNVPKDQLIEFEYGLASMLGVPLLHKAVDITEVAA